MKCNSTRPRDLCCLYNVSGFKCNHLDDPVVALDDDGFMLTVLQQDTQKMADFAGRWVASQGGRVVDENALHQLAYWYWSYQPLPHVISFSALKAELLNASCVDWHPSPTPPPPSSGIDTFWFILGGCLIILVLA